MLNGLIQCSKMTFFMCPDVVLSVGIVQVSSEDLSLMTKTYWFPRTVFGSGPRVCMATKSNRLAVEKKYKRSLVSKSASDFCPSNALANRFINIFFQMWPEKTIFKV